MSDRREFIGAATALVAGLGMGAACDGGGGAGDAAGGAGSGGASSSGGNGSATGGSAPSSGGSAELGGAGGVGACAEGIEADIVTSHPHELVIPLADAASLADEYYTVSGDDHTHGLSVSAEDFAALRAGQTVQLTCSEGGYDFPHTHAVSLSCA